MSHVSALVHNVSVGIKITYHRMSFFRTPIYMYIGSANRVTPGKCLQTLQLIGRKCRVRTALVGFLFLVKQIWQHWSRTLLLNGIIKEI